MERFGPAIAPTSAKRRSDRTPTIVAERLPDPKAKVKNDKWGIFLEMQVYI